MCLDTAVSLFHAKHKKMEIADEESDDVVDLTSSLALSGLER